MDRDQRQLEQRARRAAKRVGLAARKTSPYGFRLLDPDSNQNVIDDRCYLLAEDVIDICQWKHGWAQRLRKAEQQTRLSNDHDVLEALALLRGEFSSLEQSLFKIYELEDRLDKLRTKEVAEQLRKEVMAGDSRLEQLGSVEEFWHIYPDLGRPNVVDSKTKIK